MKIYQLKLKENSAPLLKLNTILISICYTNIPKTPDPSIQCSPKKILTTLILMICSWEEKKSSVVPKDSTTLFFLLRELKNVVSKLKLYKTILTVSNMEHSLMLVWVLVWRESSSSSVLLITLEMLLSSPEIPKD